MKCEYCGNSKGFHYCGNCGDEFELKKRDNCEDRFCNDCELNKLD